MNILSTKKYKIFKTIQGNRAVSDDHVRKLAASIARQNLLSANPIIVNEQMQVIDGQHRLLAAQSLGVEVSYVTVEGATIRVVQQLNAHQKQWALQDYAESYALQGNPHYQTLKKFYENQDLPVSIAVWLLSGGRNNGGHLSRFKDGGFEVTTEEEAYEVVEKIKLFHEHTSPQVRRSRGFVRAMFALTHSPEIDWDRMSEKLGEYTKQIPAYEGVRDYLRTLEDIYNYKNKVRTRLY